MGTFAGAVGKWGKQVVLGLAVAGLAVCFSGSAAKAQSKMQVFGGYAYGGGSTNNYCYYYCTPPSFPRQGFEASFGYNFSTHVGIEAAFDGFNGTQTPESSPVGTGNNGENIKDKGSSYLYTFGPRLTYPVGDFSLYTHLLVGGAHVHDNYTETCIPYGSGTCGSPDPYTETDSGNGMAFKIGGGVDWNHGVWGIRIVQLDYVHSQLSLSGSDNETYSPTFSSYAPGSSYEVAAGVTINFGSSLK
jgi:hypothetical protein